MAGIKLDGQPVEVLMGLWKQLCSDQRYCPLVLRQVQERAVADQELEPYVLISSLTRGGVEVPGILGHRRTGGHLLSSPFTDPHRMYSGCWH